MTAKTDFLEAATINHMFGGAPLTQPTQWWLAIYSSDPTDAVTATTPSALTTRKQITAWTRSASIARNTNPIQFDPVPSGQTWAISHFAIFTAETGGDPLYQGAFSIQRTLTAGDIFLIGANQLSVEER